MTVVGNFEELNLPDLIQFYGTSGQTARLTAIFADAEGHLYFQNGQLVDATFGSLTGLAAVYELLRRPGGTFSVEQDVAPMRRTIHEEWKTVLMEGTRLADEARRPRGATALRAVGPADGGTPAPRSNDRAAATTRPQPTPFSKAPGGSSKIPLFAGLAALLAVGAGLFVVFQRSGSAPPAVPAPRPAAAAPLELGMSAALTGPSKELGRQMKLGLEAAFAAVNESGGVLGRKIVLTAMDDGYEPARTRDVMKDLIENRKVFAVIGNVGTPTTEVALPYAIEKKTLFFGAFTGAGLLRRDPPDRFVFNYRASYAEETAAVVNYLVESRKIKPSEIAVFAQQDGFGDAGFAGVAKALRKHGLAPEDIRRVGFKRNTLEIQEAVDAISKNRKVVRAIVTVAPYRPAAKFIEKIRDLGIDAVITNVSFVGSTALAEELRQIGPKYSKGIIVTQVVPPVDSASSAVLKYRETLQKSAPGEKPDFVSLEGYLVGNLFVEALRKAGPQITTDTVIGALEGIKGLDLGIGTPLTFGPSEHQASHKVWGTVLNESAAYQVLDLE